MLAAVASWRKGAPEKIEDDVWVEEIPYAQTRSYVRRVLRSLHAYRRFY
jgi:soluble lytic murein transglycosylase-like protein